ncbi:hypothetical protein HELRODRAFT_172533 [Helobdella robusta]|uniref:Uncharacterized protein n=1 Tax=Helobdella robusta TaxID=6412 RepID=T1F5H1_HELRO|nr:hypothetical protein HELRODRAFT_172533 [Helobdella robusta]ESO04187.1 hypothetical protein HELRODRAFT_172533 [Helobdella robusta]
MLIWISKRLNIKPAIFEQLDSQTNLLNGIQKSVQQLVEKQLVINAENVDTNSLKTISPVNVNKAITVTGTHSKILVQKKSDLPLNSIKSTIESDSECDNFVLVKRKKRNNHPNRNDNSNSVPRLVVGSRAPTESKITANKLVFQNRIFHIGNVTKCVASDVVDHLRLSQVEVVSCFPAFKKDKNGVKPDDSQPSTSF